MRNDKCWMRRINDQTLFHLDQTFLFSINNLRFEQLCFIVLSPVRSKKFCNHIQSSTAVVRKFQLCKAYSGTLSRRNFGRL